MPLLSPSPAASPFESGSSSGGGGSSSQTSGPASGHSGGGGLGIGVIPSVGGQTSFP
ncbi:MAG: hypothetical protein WB053_08270 [Nitrososphaeraceae archaeon]